MDCFYHLRLHLPCDTYTTLLCTNRTRHCRTHAFVAPWCPFLQTPPLNGRVHMRSPSWSVALTSSALLVGFSIVLCRTRSQSTSLGQVIRCTQEIRSEITTPINDDCASYQTCPVRISCTWGDTFQWVGRNQLAYQQCNCFEGGRLDPSTGLCIDGTPTNSCSLTSTPIPINRCIGTCGDAEMPPLR